MNCDVAKSSSRPRMGVLLVERVAGADRQARSDRSVDQAGVLFRKALKAGT